MQVFDSALGKKAESKRINRGCRYKRGHPTTSEMDYSPRELQFMAAMEEFKRATGKKFPTWCEVLAVFKSLGYSHPLDLEYLKVYKEDAA